MSELETHEAIARYGAGAFPMDDGDDPPAELPWYVAEQRCVFELDEASRADLARRVRRSLVVAEREHWRIDADAGFDDVLAGCAVPRGDSDGVWITPRLAALYTRLHAAGVAHSIELWTADGELAAGILAVRLRRAAMLESMMHRVPEAGNALLSLALDALAASGVVLCDVQLPTPHTLRLGAQLIERPRYEARLAEALEAS
jgi:leucyl/phenylalanyl-tRNA--protein transferase